MRGNFLDVSLSNVSFYCLSHQLAATCGSCLITHWSFKMWKERMLGRTSVRHRSKEGPFLTSSTSPWSSMVSFFFNINISILDSMWKTLQHSLSKYIWNLNLQFLLLCTWRKGRKRFWPVQKPMSHCCVWWKESQNQTSPGPCKSWLLQQL